MDHRFIDILVYLAKHFQTNPFNISSAKIDVNFDDEEFEMDSLLLSLQDAGYSPSEIDSALSWYFENEKIRPQLHARQIKINPAPAIRILQPIERLVISADAYGFLTQIHQLGLISTLQLEVIIERALSSGWEVDLALVKTIASAEMFEFKDDMEFSENFFRPSR